MIFNNIHIWANLGFLLFSCSEKTERTTAPDTVDTLESAQVQQVLPRAEIEILTENMRYMPDQIELEPGREALLILVNNSKAAHNLQIDFPEGNVRFENDIAPGERDSILIRTPDRTGSYRMYCPHGDHQERGMTGNLIVEESVAVQQVKADDTTANTQQP